jgi:nucleoside-diphosphate-sugar epimerase
MKWAVIGASGFVGGRFVERMHLTGEQAVRPIVRAFSSLGRLSRFELDWRVTEHTDVPRLTEALKGCDALLHSIVGDEHVILGSIAPVYEAAKAAGVRRIVYMSSASVHGLTPDRATNEDTPLSDQQPFNYNNSKVRAERTWAKVRATGDVEIVGLRPSIVFGPRSRWCADIANEILAGTAYLVQNGDGICNTIYIDNLVSAIVNAGATPNIDGQYFLVRDSDIVTWRDFYEPIVLGVGRHMGDLHDVEPPKSAGPREDHIARLRSLSLVKLIKPLAPRVSIRVVKAAISALPTPAEPSPWPVSGAPRPHVTREMAALQQCQWQMPCTRAAKVLGYDPKVSFADGMERSVGWLKFAGFPIKAQG